MHNQRLLTHNFSKQQGKRFLVCWSCQNGLFRRSTKIYASKMMTFDAAPEAVSQCSMNGYMSENNVFSVFGE